MPGYVFGHTSKSPFNDPLSAPRQYISAGTIIDEDATAIGQSTSPEVMG